MSDNAVLDTFCRCGHEADLHDDGAMSCRGDDQDLECECEEWQSPMLHPTKEVMIRFTYRMPWPGVGYVYAVIFATDQKAASNILLTTSGYGDEWTLIAHDVTAYNQSEVMNDKPNRPPE